MSRVDLIRSDVLGTRPVEFFRRPRSRKRRIIKKWRARPGNWRKLPELPEVVCINSINLDHHPVLAVGLCASSLIRNEARRQVAATERVCQDSLAYYFMVQDTENALAASLFTRLTGAKA